jgi:hypothetical protein
VKKLVTKLIEQTSPLRRTAFTALTISWGLTAGWIGAVSSKGFVLSSAWATPATGLSLSGGITYAFANIDNFGAAGSLFVPDLASPSEHRLNVRLSCALLWSGVVSAAYTRPISAALQFRANVTEKYSSCNIGSDLNPQKLARQLRDIECDTWVGRGRWEMDRGNLGSESRRQGLRLGVLAPLCPVPSASPNAWGTELNIERSSVILYYFRPVAARWDCFD